MRGAEIGPDAIGARFNGDDCSATLLMIAGKQLASD